MWCNKNVAKLVYKIDFRWELFSEKCDFRVFSCYGNVSLCYMQEDKNRRKVDFLKIRFTKLYTRVYRYQDSSKS